MDNESSEKSLLAEEQEELAQSPNLPPELRGQGPKIPIWVRVAVVAGLLILSSLSYFSSIFRYNGETSKGESISLDQDDVTVRKSVGTFNIVDSQGQAKPITDFKGRVVILSFWASWCAPCLVELPEFANIQQRFADRGLEIIPINVDDGTRGVEFAREFWKTKDFAFNSYFDADKKLAARFEVDTLPANFVLDRQGRLAFSGFGANNWTSEETIQFLEDLLDEN